MNKYRLDYIKASQKRMGIHGNTKRFALINELLTEIGHLNALLEGEKAIVTDYAATILILRNKLDIVQGGLSSATKRIGELEGDLPMIGTKE